MRKQAKNGNDLLNYYNSIVGETYGEITQEKCDIIYNYEIKANKICYLDIIFRYADFDTECYSTIYANEYTEPFNIYSFEENAKKALETMQELKLIEKVLYYESMQEIAIIKYNYDII